MIKCTAAKTVIQFLKTGSVKDRVKPGQPSTVTNEIAPLDVLQSFVEDPQESHRYAANSHDISHESIRKVMKSAGFKPHNVKLRKELKEDDFHRWLEFWEVMMNRIYRNQIDPNNILSNT